MLDGCHPHAIALERVEAWWRRAKGRKEELACCECCGGPFPAEFTTDPANGQQVGVGGKCRYCMEGA